MFNKIFLCKDITYFARLYSVPLIQMLNCQLRNIEINNCSVFQFSKYHSLLNNFIERVLNL